MSVYKQKGKDVMISITNRLVVVISISVTMIISLVILSIEVNAQSSAFNYNTILNVLHNDNPILNGHTNYKTRVETGQVLSKPVSWYIPKNTSQTDSPINLYRLEYNGVDHMDSSNANEGFPNYQVDDTLGVTWGSSKPGTASLIRHIHATNGDHATFDLAHVYNDYQYEGAIGGFGFPRHGEIMGFGGNRTKPILISASAGDLEIKFDISAGATGDELNWKGFQYIQNYGYGYMLNQALFREGIPDSEFAPTEAGDIFQHGSPVLEFGGGGANFTSTTLPLQFNPAMCDTCANNGSTDKNAVLWGGSLRKTVRIIPPSDMASSDAFSQVCWRSGFNVPINDPYNGQYEREWVSLHVQPSLTTVREWTPATGFVNVPLAEGQSLGIEHPGIFAVFYMNSTKTNAIGIVSNGPYIILLRNTNHPGKPEEDVMKMSGWDRGSLSKGTFTDREFVIMPADLSTSAKELIVHNKLLSMVNGLCPPQ